MQDKIIIKAPAKINLFLRIYGQKENGYHMIRTGVTFVNLYDEIKIKLNDKNDLSYSGPFKPSDQIYKDDIIRKILLKKNLIKKNIKLKINIKKNIPYGAGLGSASTDAASFIKYLQNFKLINNFGKKYLSSIGADVPVCYYGKNCLANGIGDNIFKNIEFQKYYFVLVYPHIKLSTTKMYNKIKKYIKFNYEKNIYNLKTIHEKDFGNDFEKIVENEHEEVANLLNYLSNLKYCIFARMSGSGSCCYVVFNKKDLAKKAYQIISKKFKNYWVFLAENNNNL